MTSPTTENDLAEGDSRAAALRSLKRRLTRVVFHHLHTDQNNRRQLHHTVA
jgi:transposase